MISNLERYKNDLGSLIKRGNSLNVALAYSLDKSAVEKQLRQQIGDETKAYIENLPDFKDAYQGWYSEAKALIRQLLPDRVEDFTRSLTV